MTVCVCDYAAAAATVVTPVEHVAFVAFIDLEAFAFSLILVLIFILCFDSASVVDLILVHK